VASPASNAGTVTVRMDWGTGDLQRLNKNDPVTVGAAGNYTLIDLGTIHVPKTPRGTQQWQGTIYAESTVAGDDIEIDCLFVFPITEGYGEASSIPPLESPSSLSVYDYFDQTAGALVGKTLPSGGTWSGVGDTDDFAVNATTAVASRTAVSDTAPGRVEVAGSVILTGTTVQADVKSTVVPVVAGQVINTGVVLRYTDVNNFARAYASFSKTVRNGFTTYGISLALVVRVAGVETTYTGSGGWSGSSYTAPTMTVRATAYADGTVYAWLGQAGRAFGAPGLAVNVPALSSTGALASGKVGIYDYQPPSDASTRTVDNFFAFAPSTQVPDAALYALQSLEVRGNSVVREDSTGTIWSTPSVYRGDYFLIPPAGAEGRTTRIIVKASQGDPSANGLDGGIDDISAQVTYIPRFLHVPE
jgi:hypothetical protein